MTVDEIMAAVGDNALYNLHGHTQYCDGRATMADFAAKAASMGFALYGFTPHSPLPIESSCNMSPADVPLYLAEVDRLQLQFPQTRFLKGMEVDYLNPGWGADNEYFRSLPLDYMISSVHFIPNQEGEYYDIDGRPDSFRRKLHEHFHGDVQYVVDKFFEHSQQMVSAGGFQIIGHFDKIKLNAGLCSPGLEDSPAYRRHVDDLVDSIIAAGVIVEINTKSWEDYGHFFPSQRHWRRLLQAGVPVVVNSDAHYIERINAHRPEVLKSLRYLRTSVQ